MAKFILLLRNDPEDRREISPADMQKIVERYRNWAIAQAGKVIRAESYKLARDGQTLTSRAGAVTMKDGPYAETKDVIGGFFMVEAADAAAAREIARTCPHLEGNGSIEIRPVDG